jgi:hypothetical protein
MIGADDQQLITQMLRPNPTGKHPIGMPHPRKPTPMVCRVIWRDCPIAREDWAKHLPDPAAVIGPNDAPNALPLTVDGEMAPLDKRKPDG